MPYLPKRLRDLGLRGIIPTSGSAETPGQDQGALSASENTHSDPVLIETDVISSIASTKAQEHPSQILDLELF